PATYALIGRWSVASDRARLLAIVVSGATLGAPGGLMISGWLVEHAGWQTAFYSFGAVGLAWASFWLLRTHGNPDEDPRIGEAEKDLLAESRVSREAKVAVPWKKIISHPAIWAIIIAKFCALWTVYVFLAWLPSYFSAIQGISVAGSGLFAALPWIAMSAMLYVASWRADGMIRLGRDVTYVRKLMQSIGLLGSTVFLLLVPFAGSALTAVTLTCLAMGMLAFCYSGADPTVMEVAPRYSGSITGLVGTIGNLPGIIAIPLIGLIVDSTGSYSSGFVLAAAINVVGIVVWLKFGTARKIID
ncbi:MAG: MFS transporter, partial [Gammaproteobacteria bacterium]|nr:MFS transporter [Gammaproteobacteria bacterium]